MNEIQYDLCVIGGGINGAGIARDAALNGLSVCLLEAHELAAGTSSSSTKLIHGGLRYLENYEFKMVREALIERKRLFKVAPDMIVPLEIIIPHDNAQRPKWMIRAGLFLYDYLVPKRGVPASRGVNLKSSIYGAPLQDRFTAGFAYFDGWTDDAALVRRNAHDAAAHGANVLTRHACTGLREEGGVWRVTAHDILGNADKVLSAKMVVNATGPWVRRVVDELGVGDGEADLPNVKMVKGSHIIVPRRYDGEHAYLLQQADGRVIFVIPYKDNTTLIGTTEEAFEGDPIEAEISSAEMEYLCAAYSASFTEPITVEDIVDTYSGVRPLFDDGAVNASKVTRDFKIYRHKAAGAPLWSIFGGKLTTYRILSEKVLRKVCGEAGRRYVPHTRTTLLPPVSEDI